MGPSGAGKDTILRIIRSKLPSNVLIAKRYITRPYDPVGEEHTPISEDIFNCLQEQNQFAMSWQSHGYKYGIGREINEWLACGVSVIVNGSREWYPKARKRFPDLCPVVIDISENTLKRRLLARGRENHEQIAARLQRARAYREHLREVKTISNNGAPEDAASVFLQFVYNMSQTQKSDF